MMCYLYLIWRTICSVFASAAKKDKVTTFSESKCEIRDAKSRLVACGRREGSLYYLEYDGATQEVHSVGGGEKLTGTTWELLGIGGMAVWSHLTFLSVAFSTSAFHSRNH